MQTGPKTFDKKDPVKYRARKVNFNEIKIVHGRPRNGEIYDVT